MYFATDISAIQAAMEAKAPRPIRDILMEHYPDCTIDRNNRAHAPYDGYECQFTGKQFRAGEYLPFEPSEDQEIMRKGNTIRALWVYSEGEVFCLEGTKGQIRAGAEIAKNQAAEFDKNVDHVGEAKQRVDLKLRLFARFSEFGLYGTEYTHLLRDENNNPIVYKGTTKLEAELGDLIELKATIKSHWTSKYDGRKATYINRPKLKGN